MATRYGGTHRPAHLPAAVGSPGKVRGGGCLTSVQAVLLLLLQLLLVLLLHPLM